MRMRVKLGSCEEPEKRNLSGLKLKYYPKTGQFKGTFKIYVTNAAAAGSKKPKLKKFTVRTAGFVIDGVGYGQAFLKKPRLSFPVRIE